MDIYILFALLCILIFLGNIIGSIFRWLKGHFSSTDFKINKKSIDNLARYIVTKGCSDIKLDDSFDICKQAVSICNGFPIDHKTGILEVDIYNWKVALSNAIKLEIKNKIDYIIMIADHAIREFPAYVSVFKDELLRIALESILVNRKFLFDPSQKKYKLSQEFIDTYNIKTGIAEAIKVTDLTQKMKILEKLHKKYNGNVEISEQLLNVIVDIPGNENRVRNLVLDIFKIQPNRKLVMAFFKSYTGKVHERDMLNEAEDLLSQIPDSNIEKIWFLLQVAVRSRKYPQIAEYLKVLKGNNANHMELCSFYVDNYAILSAEPEIISLLCN